MSYDLGGNGMKFESAYEEFIVYAEKRHKKQGFITLNHDFKKYILPYFKDKNITDITKNDILNWQNYILDFGFKNSFNFKLYSFFNSFFSYCVLFDIVSFNPVSLVGNFSKKIELNEHTTYNFYQFLKFVFYLDNFVYKCFFTFMFFYGTRPGETMALRFSDLSGHYVHINHNLQRKGKRELDTPKNLYSVRKFKIGIIMRFLIFILKRKYIKSSSFSNDYFIFGGLKPLAPTSIDRIKNNAIKKSNLPYITQHEFRHSFCTRMIRKNVPIKDVSCRMGHHNVSTTLDIYLH